MRRHPFNSSLSIISRHAGMLALALLLLLITPNTSLAANQPRLYQQVDLFAIADEAAAALGWSERAGDFDNYGAAIKIEHSVEDGTCRNYDSVSSNRHVGIILIRAESSPEEAEQSASHYGSETPVLPEPFHEFNGYRVSPAPTGVYFSWAMGNVRLTAGSQAICLPDGLVLDPMPIAEALYAAAVYHGLGTELPSPVDATPTSTPPAEYGLQGTVTDGYKNPVRYAKVRLTFGENERFTVTDGNGRYQFTGLPGGAVAGFDPAQDAYRVTVFLQYAPDGGTPLYQVLYGSDTGPVVAPVSRPFSLSGSASVLKYDLNFGYTSDWQLNLLEKIDRDLPARLSSVAAIYVHVSQAVDLADQLDQEISHPFNVVAFTRGQSGACWYGRMSNGTRDWNGCLNLSNKQYSLGFGEGVSWYASSDRPANREWHEFGHHFLADAFGGFMPGHVGRRNHEGYYINSRSTDAWTEGFAEFFAMMVNRQIIGDPNFMEYKYDGTTAILETNYKTWEDEEFALAGLLLDLVDDAGDYPAAQDDDPFSETVEDVWTVISKGVSTESDGNGHIFDVVDLYNNLTAWGAGSDDLDKNGRADLKDLFIAHGFFDDIDGDRKYASGDRIGYTSHLSTPASDGTLRPAMTDRRDKPCLPGAYIAYTATSATGGVVTGAAFKVDVLLDPPHDYLNVSYTVPAEALRDGRLCIMLPPSDYPSHVRIVAIADGYQESSPVEITSADFWSKVPNPSDPPLLTHTFTLKSQNNLLTPMLFVGIFGLCGLGGALLVGLVLWRRKASVAVPAEGSWVNVLLIVVVAGLCCVVVAAGGLMVWRNNPAPLPSAYPVNTQPVFPSLPAVTPVVSLAIPTQPLATALLPDSPSASVLFQDDFSDPGSGWDDVRADEEANTYYFEGNYLIVINPADLHAWANPYLNFPGDVRVEVDARKTSGSTYDEFGLLCRYARNSDDTYSYYYFAISVDGLGVIYKVDHGKKSLLLSESPQNRSDVIHSGDQVNRIRADCIGDRLTLYVNGESLVDAVDSSFRSGDVGLRADSETGGTEIRFDNFIVYKPGD